MLTGCPCGSGHGYDECCGALHGGAAAATAELLMRSRFSAFAVGDAEYLRRTWHPTTRPRRLDPDPGVRWTRLEVLATEGGGLFDRTGVVEFRAHYRENGRADALRERSTFVRENGAWTYVGPERAADGA
ncbi:YchJ family protein [Rhizomonospora bruguierae]|uniref:YchJ family protein n=1 Tax=Rhizomonospora bruguierae TaxID=1581705 RepID=UPI001BCFEDD4|nr:YchJ family metal-binding protein [Micromonospora sp. NBRC 107566]